MSDTDQTGYSNSMIHSFHISYLAITSSDIASDVKPRDPNFSLSFDSIVASLLYRSPQNQDHLRTAHSELSNDPCLCLSHHDYSDDQLVGPPTNLHSPASPSQNYNYVRMLNHNADPPILLLTDNGRSIGMTLRIRSRKIPRLWPIPRVGAHAIPLKIFFRRRTQNALRG